MQAMSWPWFGRGTHVIPRLLFPMPFVAGHTAVIATLQPVPGFRLDTTTSGAATFLVCTFAPSLPKCFWRMCEEAGRGRRNRCDEKSTQDVVAVWMLDF